MPMIGVQEALQRCAAGGFVIIIDEENPSSQGDLMIAGELVTPQALNFMLREARGMMYVPMAPERLDDLADSLALFAPDFIVARAGGLLRAQRGRKEH